MKSLDKELGKVIKKIFARQNPIVAELIVNWGKIVGINFSKYSYPIKIITAKSRGQNISTLTIGVNNASIAMEMSFHQELILERIAVYLGYKGVHKTKLVIRN